MLPPRRSGDHFDELCTRLGEEPGHRATGCGGRGGASQVQPEGPGHRATGYGGRGGASQVQLEVRTLR